MYSWKICMSLEIGQMLLSKIQQNKRLVSLKKAGSGRERNNIKTRKKMLQLCYLIWWPSNLVTFQTKESKQMKHAHIVIFEIFIKQLTMDGMHGWTNLFYGIQQKNSRN